MLVVPTGVGAAIGGYAGDALPVARGLASVVDTLVTHPNVMNGASLYWPQDNILYTEGYALDEFAGGRWGLRPFARGRGGHRVGLVLDKAMEEEMRLRHLQVGVGLSCFFSSVFMPSIHLFNTENRRRTVRARRWG